MKQNFTSKTSKVFRTSANDEHKGFNSCVRDVLNVWNRGKKSAELAESIEAARADGVNESDFSAAYIIKHLEGTNFVRNGVIGQTKKGEFTPKSTWTAGQVIDYVRRASRAHIMAQNKNEKNEKNEK